MLYPCKHFISLPRGSSGFAVPVFLVIEICILSLCPATPFAAYEQSAGLQPICGISQPGSSTGDIMPGSSQYVRPPDGPYTLGSAHFVIHYSDTLLGAYAQRSLDAAERSYRVLIDTLGFVVPPSDGANGGDSRTDIYIISASGVPFSGLTVWEDLVPSPPYTAGATGFFEVVDTLLANLDIVTAHEYFHVVQIGYDYSEDLTFLEMISVWAEERVYDSLNSYLSRLPVFFATPQKPLMDWRYSNVLWAVFLTENFGDGMLVNVLDQCGLTPGPNSLNATDTMLGAEGTMLTDQFARFTLWNYFTGARDDGYHYSEGSLYPDILFEKDTECLPLNGYLTHFRPGPLACNYLMFLGDHNTDTLSLSIKLNPDAEWIITVTRFIGGGAVTINHYYPTTVGWSPHMIAVEDWFECDSLMVITNVVSWTGTSFEYILSASHNHPNAPASPYILVLDRDGCARPFDGINDDFNYALGEEYAFGKALSANSINFIVSDSLPADLSLCGAIYIIGGFNLSGANLVNAEMQALMGFMDRGGDVFLESSRLGEWLDPLQGSPDSTQVAFWSYWGCNFQPGASMVVGNVDSWRTVSSSPLSGFAFAYDNGGAPDDYVGSLSPLPQTDTLVVDQSGVVRGTAAHGSEGSERIYMTVMLGGSGYLGAQQRADFMRRVLDVFDTIVTTFSIAFMNVEIEGPAVRLHGELVGYEGQSLKIERIRRDDLEGITSVPFNLLLSGNRTSITAADVPGPGDYTYNLISMEAGGARLIWQRDITTAGAAPALVLLSASPNPSVRTFSFIVSSSAALQARVAVYDVAGRLVYDKNSVLSAGINSLAWKAEDSAGGLLPSGVYFLRISAGKSAFSKKLVVLH